MGVGWGGGGGGGGQKGSRYMRDEVGEGCMGKRMEMHVR